MAARSEAVVREGGARSTRRSKSSGEVGAAASSLT